MPDSYELRVWADGVVCDAEGNVVEQPKPEDEPETEESN